MLIRPRRNRTSAAIRDLAAESHLSPRNLVLPVFLQEGQKQRTPIPSLPGMERLSADELLRTAEEAFKLGIPAIALFPVIPEEKKDSRGTESLNEEGLLQNALRLLSKELPELLLITDVALDPYSSDGHDGIVKDGKILNDESLPVLAQMAVAQARAGAGMVAPSDMMDGRVAALRMALDEEGFNSAGILSYCVKYASAFYGPFRDALDSAPKFGDKKTYQMDPRNAIEGLRELRLDEEEGADMVMVKPGLPYLDVVRLLAEATELPVAAYHVSGEFAMLKAAAANGWLDYEACLLESLLAFKRAGARLVFTYGAMDAARALR